MSHRQRKLLADDGANLQRRFLRHRKQVETRTDAASMVAAGVGVGRSAGYDPVSSALADQGAALRQGPNQLLREKRITLALLRDVADHLGKLGSSPIRSRTNWCRSRLYQFASATSLKCAHRPPGRPGRAIVYNHHNPGAHDGLGNGGQEVLAEIVEPVEILEDDDRGMTARCRYHPFQEVAQPQIPRFGSARWASSSGAGSPRKFSSMEGRRRRSHRAPAGVPRFLRALFSGRASS